MNTITIDLSNIYYTIQDNTLTIQDEIVLSDNCFKHLGNELFEIDILDLDNIAIDLLNELERFNNTCKTLKDQWDTMINSGRIPVLEYQVSEDKWLTVNIYFRGSCLLFSFDKEPICDTYFSGEIEKVLDNYQIDFDWCFDNLDRYLQMIDQEMTEGYLIPNNLYYVED